MTTVDVKIDVTEEDIRRGTRQDFFNCPVARAGKRCLHGSCGVHEHIFVEGNIAALVPEDVRRRIEHYDLTGEMQPFSFTVAVDEELLATC